MAFKKLTAAALGGLIASFAYAPSAQATGDLWLEGSYEFLNLPNVQFINNYFFQTGADGVVRDEFVNDDGDFGGFRIDGGIANIPIMGGAYSLGIKGFFAWHDDRSDLVCSHTSATPGTTCFANPLVDPSPAVVNSPGSSPNGTDRFTTERDIDHWGLALDIARGPGGLSAGPAFRRIDQDITITGQEVVPGSAAAVVVRDPYQLTYSESLETNYWGAFVGLDGGIELGGGWSLQGDAEAGLYWADTDYSGNYSVASSSTATANLNQQLSLDSDELAFIGTLKASLEKDFGLFKLAGFGRLEYISSAPDMAYNDFDRVAGGVIQGPDDETRIGERYAYSLSTGARVTVPMGGGQ